MRESSSLEGLGEDVEERRVVRPLPPLPYVKGEVKVLQVRERGDEVAGELLDVQDVLCRHLLLAVPVDAGREGEGAKGVTGLGEVVNATGERVHSVVAKLQGEVDESVGDGHDEVDGGVEMAVEVD